MNVRNTRETIIAVLAVAKTLAAIAIFTGGGAAGAALADGYFSQLVQTILTVTGAVLVLTFTILISAIFAFGGKQERAADKTPEVAHFPRGGQEV